MLELLTTPERVNQALQALVRRATLEDRDAQRIGQLLLAMSDGCTYSVDLQDLTYLPPQIMDNVRHLINFHLATGLPLKGLIGQEELGPLIEKWGAPKAAVA